MAIQLIPTLAPAPQANQALGQSDEQLEQIKQYIAALRAAKQPVRHWAQGASNLVGDLLEGAAQGKVNDALGARQAGATQEYVRALQTPGSQPDETTLSTGLSGGPAAGAPPAGPPGVPGSAAAPMAPGGDDLLTRIASIVNQGETGRGANFDAHTLASKSHDTNNSSSHGWMGLNTKTGSAGAFARDYPELGITAPPGTPEFDAQWRNASFNKTDAMRKAQMDHFDKTQVQPTYADLQRLGIPTAIASDPRVLGYFTDRHVQQGKLGQDNIINAYQASGNDPVRFLHNMDRMDGSQQSLQRFFPNALAQGVYSARGHATRLATRLGGALGLGPGEGALAASPNAPSAQPIGAGQAADASGADPHVQSMVQALSGQQTAQAGPPSAAAPNQSNEYLQHMANFLRMGHSPAQAQALSQNIIEAKRGLAPQYKYDDPYGREYTEVPGQPRRYTGRQFGPGKEIAVPGMPFSYSETLGPNNEIIRKPNIPQFPPGNAPATIPSGGTAVQPAMSWRDWKPQMGPPPLPTSDMPPQEQYQLLQALPAMQESYKAYKVEGGKESALLEQKRTLEQQAFENQQIREKEEARIAADTSPQAIKGAASKAALTKRAEDYVKKQGIIQRSSESATAELPQLEMLKRVIGDPEFQSGIFAKQISNLAQIADRTGFAPNRVASLLQFAKKLGAAGSLENISEMSEKGAVRVPEMNMIEKSNFDENNTKEANAAVVEIRARLAQRAIDYAQKAREYARAHNDLLDSGFDQEIADYYRDKPLFSDDEIRSYDAQLDSKKPASTELNRAAAPPQRTKQIPPGWVPLGAP